MPFLWASLVLALVGAAAIVAFESPIRAAGGLLTVFVGVAAAAGAWSVPVVPGFVLWVGAGGIGVLLLGAALVLSVAAEERTRRRIALRPTLGLLATAALWALLARAVPRTLDTGSALSARAVSDALATDLAAPLGVALVALATSVIVTLGLVRRRT
jgi:NADH:ubiquinone oxidoreductase subunit 6 (subunit J)